MVQKTEDVGSFKEISGWLRMLDLVFDMSDLWLEAQLQQSRQTLCRTKEITK